MNKRNAPRCTTANEPGKITRSKLSLIRGSAILFYDDEQRAWIAPGRVLIYNHAVANAVANRMRVLMEGK